MEGWGCLRCSWLILLLLASSISFIVCKPPPGSGASPLYSGYIELDRKPGSSLFYGFWEKKNSSSTTDETPVLLWLQGGPGCASSFGAFYELGPYVTDAGGKLMPNPFAWNTNYGLLIIDQPIGTGYSIAASQDDVPQDMTEMAQDLYEGIWKFFHAHPDLQQRPLFITGESYAGKYIPSIAHYILQAEDGDPQQQHQAGGRTSSRRCRLSRHKQQQPQQQQQHQEATQGESSSSSDRSSGANAAQLPHSSKLLGRSGGRHQAGSAWQQLWQQWRTLALSGRQDQQQAARSSPELPPPPPPQQPQLCWRPRHPRALDLSSVPAPNFDLVGIAIGNGLTDPTPQTRALASVVFSMGLVSEATEEEISQRTEDVVQLVAQGAWEQATRKRSELLDFIQQEAGLATLLDVRRTEAYDASKAVDALLDTAEVRGWMGATQKASSSYSSCSSTVEAVMAADVMRSVLVLVEDLLDTLPVLLYQGQFDAQDGVAGTNAWIKRLDWPHTDDFEQQEGQLWYVTPGVPAGWRRSVSTLTQVVVRNAGHMAPRDQPAAVLAMLQQWVGDVLDGVEGRPQQEQQQQQQRQHPEEEGEGEEGVRWQPRRRGSLSSSVPGVPQLAVQ